MVDAIDIVLDLGFGDAGKGLAVDFLCAKKPRETLVVRFSGGHQVGHTVVVEKRRHVFSHFGAGTFRGCPTFYSKDTTVFLPGLVREAALIADLQPFNYYDPLVSVTTPYDIAFNRASERINQHGSCGVGFGATLKRNAAGITLFVKDLQFEWVFKQKLAAIRDYYETKLEKFGQSLVKEFWQHLVDYRDADFVEACKESQRYWAIQSPDSILPRFERLVFEGSQGIMLDQHHGIFPHMTPSFTTSRNVWRLLEEARISGKQTVIHYVTRCYQTRHGNGPMSSEKSVELRNLETESNGYNPYQGVFRTAELDIELLNYALASDEAEHRTSMPIRKGLIITCLDQRPEFDTLALAGRLTSDFDTVHGSYGPDSAAMKKLYCSRHERFGIVSLQRS